MSESSQKRSEEFLRICDQFKLGALVTESSHPVTANLSETARRDIAEGLSLLFQVDDDVIAKYREFAESGRAMEIKNAMLRALKSGGRIFFTGCGATGRLSIQLVSIWRDFWRRQRGRSGDPAERRHPSEKVSAAVCQDAATEFENRAISVMAGGDFALIKSVEGFEDFIGFGKKQIGDLSVSAKDIVFAITEGGETSFVIGTAWKGVEAGAKVYFVYNNPDDVLCEHVERSRGVIRDPRIEKINLTTGPMAIAGSTRMQATTIQLCVLLTVLEMAVRDLMKESGRDALPRVLADQQVGPTGGERCDSAIVPAQFLAKLEELHATLRSDEVLSQLAQIVALEESVYRAGGKNNYFADRFGIDVLTDTTERSPTYCTPPFRKFDDTTATESWAFLFVPAAGTAQAWERIIKRQPHCVEWSAGEVEKLVSPDRLQRTSEIIRKISSAELMRFKVGLDGLKYRPLGPGDSAVAIVSEWEKDSLLAPNGFHRVQLEAAHKTGAKIGVIFFGRAESLDHSALRTPHSALVPLPRTDFLLDGVTRVGVKMVLNALSTCTMVRLGRVMGNTMIWVVPSNLKLIDRATRYVQKLTSLDYAKANQLLFEVIEYIEPRMKADQAYPPVVGLSVMRARHEIGNEEAEKRLMAEIG